jgi:hypothetical protein
MGKGTTWQQMKRKRGLLEGLLQRAQVEGHPKKPRVTTQKNWLGPSSRTRRIERRRALNRPLMGRRERLFRVSQVSGTTLNG